MTAFLITKSSKNNKKHFLYKHKIYKVVIEEFAKINNFRHPISLIIFYNDYAKFNYGFFYMYMHFEDALNLLRTYLLNHKNYRLKTPETMFGAEFDVNKHLTELNYELYRIFARDIYFKDWLGKISIRKWTQPEWQNNNLRPYAEVEESDEDEDEDEDNDEE